MESNCAIYFNNLYIGEAKSFKWKKAKKDQMPILEIVGDYQDEEKSSPTQIKSKEVKG